MGCTGVQASNVIVFTDCVAELSRVRDPGVQAVIFKPVRRASWETSVETAVESGAFVIERFCNTVERSEELVHTLEHCLPNGGLEFETRLALIDDLAALADQLGVIAGCRKLMLRLFTEAPTEHCGFHVDTVAPGRPPFGLLKVYNGQGTIYVDPCNVVRMRDFYEYLGRRENLVRLLRQALDDGHTFDAQAHSIELEALDAALPFLRSSELVNEVPVGSTVAFRHIDISEHWSDHETDCAWIHCSPMAGGIRLVANLTPLDDYAGPPL